MPVILCGCQNDLRHDPEVVASLCKRGRAPVSPEQALGKKCSTLKKYLGLVHVE